MSKYRTMVDVIESAFRLFPDRLAVRWRDEKEQFQELKYSEFEELVKALSVGLVVKGVKNKQHIGLIADVSYQWLLSNFAIQLAGGIDVPRGTDSTGDELGYILDHSESSVVFVHNAEQIDKINAGLKKHSHKVTTYIVMNDKVGKSAGKNVLRISDVIEAGRKAIASGAREYKEWQKRKDSIAPDDLCTIIYTSGTTGEPKGVMLRQRNFASQLNILPGIIKVEAGDRGLTLLPPWHVFGRIAEYMFFATGCSITYTDIKHIGEDMRHIRPTYVPAVPRIWEGVYNKILGGVKKSGKEGIFNFFKGFALNYKRNLNLLTGKEKLYVKRNPVLTLLLKIKAFFALLLLVVPKKLGDILVFKKVLAATGGQLRASISGGGALPGYIDDFFAAIGINILEGYGLTETSPVLSVRRPDRIIPGTVGPLIEGTEGKIIDAEGKDVTGIPDAKGTLHVRGPQVMAGYYKNPKKTKEVLTDDGWFNTGDLVKFTVTGEISIVGRSKDTIVLVGGENVEPTPIEEKLKESPYIDQVMCVGQDQKSIGALIVPNEEELRAFAAANNIPGNSLADWVNDPKINSLIQNEIKRLISIETGFKSFERVTVFRLLSQPFRPGIEMNNTLKVKRHVVSDMYASLIKEMYK